MALFAAFIPILSFFLAYQFFNLYVATLVTIAAPILQVMISFLQSKPITIAVWVNFTIVMLLGVPTLVYKNSEIIKLKPSIGFIFFAFTCILTHYRTGMTLVEHELNHVLHLPQRTWSQLNTASIIFCCSMSLLNIIVAYITDTDTWVYFKLFGLVGLTALFIISQIIYIFLIKKY